MVIYGYPILQCLQWLKRTDQSDDPASARLVNPTFWGDIFHHSGAFPAPDTSIVALPLASILLCTVEIKVPY